ncbi:MAG: hypothetical protein ACHQEM_04565 [Chitinophagales bacterium]
MKTILPVLALVSVLGLGAGSSILFMNMDYITSALLTVSFVIGISFLIAQQGNQKETK